MRAPPRQKIILRREIILIAQRIDALIFVKFAAIQFHGSGVALHHLARRAGRGNSGRVGKIVRSAKPRGHRAARFCPRVRAVQGGAHPTAA